MQLAGFTGDDAPRAVLLFFVVRPKMLGIMAGLTQKDSCLEEYRKNGFSGSLRHMFPYSALWFDIGYIFISVYRGLVFCSPFISGSHVRCWVFAFGVQVYGIL